MATTRMDEALYAWICRHNVGGDAYIELLSILGVLPATESCTSDGVFENTNFDLATATDPRDVQVQTSSISTSDLSHPDHYFPYGTFPGPSPANDRPANHPALVDFEFEFDNLGEDSQVFQGRVSPQFLNENTQWLRSSESSTDLVPALRQPVHVTTPLSAPERNGPACIRCWKWKKACKPTKNGICEPCAKASFPSRICIRVRIADETVFAKWKNSNYEQKLAWENLNFLDSSAQDFDLVPVFLRHDNQGPHLRAVCRRFTPASADQTLLYFKRDKKWERMQSTPFALMGHDDLDTYVVQYTKFYIQQIGNGRSWNDQIFAEAKKHCDDSLIWNALKLWAAHRLLMKGWQISEHKPLGMCSVTDSRSSLYNQRPAPRVIQNQGDKKLERYVAVLEGLILRELQKAMRGTIQKGWIIIFTTVLVLLLVREKDIWRLLYWINHPEERYQWRHPEAATTLVRRSLHLTNILLAHVHISGQVPRQLRMHPQLPLAGASNSDRIIEQEDRENQSRSSQPAAIKTAFNTAVAVSPPLTPYFCTLTSCCMPLGRAIQSN